ncbi:pyridoxamine 5'-phosphate oxidase family protein [Desulfosporosinus sp. Sb-LF]|uniref:pyridoxamine 5'-phosphate oxidase family protein n=1 Tax=Desulfosporosinus sp. Sb-LF TaxID=2560027 RepID=UPI00107F651B|nr:pyridoxamine 5'-phosphate oxidase family protein [Desulfosporosinus sp. Sb-LF]TGE34371.1 pyridoxamine 5'-phosphate oxidase family protein [Desulfosporosinus sp. Sb-LF]
MLNEKLLEVLAHPADGEVAIVTQGEDGPHVVNTWNSYVHVTEDDRLLIPVSRMHNTEKNIERDNRVKLTIGSREVQGTRYKGTGFLITGTAKVVKEGPEFDMTKERFSWPRAVLEITIDKVVHTL